MLVYDKSGNQCDLVSSELGSNSNGNYIKFSNGIAICWGYVICKNNEQFITATFPIQFRAGTTPNVATMPKFITEKTTFVSYGKCDNISIQLFLTDMNNKTTHDRATDYIAIGKWK